MKLITNVVKKNWKLKLRSKKDPAIETEIEVLAESEEAAKLLYEAAKRRAPVFELVGIEPVECQ